MMYHQTDQSPINQKKSMLLLTLDIFKIEQQQTNTKDQSFILKTIHEMDAFRFYAPNEIQENINHSWEEHDSMAGRMGQIVTSIQAGVQDIGLAVVGGSTKGQAYKLDSPLVWKNSPRREYSFPITLLDQDNPEKITGCVQDLKRMSSAKASPGMLSAVEFPYIFRVRMSPGAMIFIESAALTGVQSTYHYPYVDGYPTKIDLQLTFLDLQPLFQHAFAGEMTTRVTTKKPAQ